MEAVFRECVDDERQRGRTVLLSSHILAEAEALADRVTIIRDGRTAETGTLAEMRHLTRTTVDAELPRRSVLDGLPGVHAAEVRGTHLHCEVDPAALNDVLTRLTAAGVVALTCRPPTLEELFLRHYSPNGPGRGHPMTSPPRRTPLAGTGRPGPARLPPGPDHAARLGVRDHRGDRQQLLQPEQAVPHRPRPGPTWPSAAAATRRWCSCTAGSGAILSAR
jgi:hypothetical protein